VLMRVLQRSACSHGSGHRQSMRLGPTNHPWARQTQAYVPSLRLRQVLNGLMCLAQAVRSWQRSGGSIQLRLSGARVQPTTHITRCLGVVWTFAVAFAHKAFGPHFAGIVGIVQRGARVAPLAHIELWLALLTSYVPGPGRIQALAGISPICMVHTPVQRALQHSTRVHGGVLADRSLERGSAQGSGGLEGTGGRQLSSDPTQPGALHTHL